jgi:hypothetical protein
LSGSSSCSNITEVCLAQIGDVAEHDCIALALRQAEQGTLQIESLDHHHLCVPLLRRLQLRPAPAELIDRQISSDASNPRLPVLADPRPALIGAGQRLLGDVLSHRTVAENSIRNSVGECGEISELVVETWALHRDG